MCGFDTLQYKGGVSHLTVYCHSLNALLKPGEHFKSCVNILIDRVSHTKWLQPVTGRLNERAFNWPTPVLWWQGVLAGCPCHGGGRALKGCITGWGKHWWEQDRSEANHKQHHALIIPWETSAPKWLTLPKSQDSTSTLGPSAPAPLRPPAGPGSSSPLPGGASHGPYWAMALWPSPGLCLTPVCLCRVSSRPTSPWHLHCLATLTHLMCRNAFVLCCKVPNPNVTPNHTPSISVLLSLPFFCTLKFY